jgi:DNA recombination protein RmuC
MGIAMIDILIIFLSGALLGGAVAWYAKKSTIVPQNDTFKHLHEQLQLQNNALQTNISHKDQEIRALREAALYTPATNPVPEAQVLKPVQDQLLQQNAILQNNLSNKENEIRALRESLATKAQIISHLEEKLDGQKQQSGDLQQHFRAEFSSLVDKVIEEKNQRFANQSQQQIGTILAPLREQIKFFEDSIEKRFSKETEDRLSLRKEIEQLRDLNWQLSQDANNLVTAIKGENKLQGDWGELRLELILEKAGLSKNVHYSTQVTLLDADGKSKRPDFIIYLPDNRHLIIDSKVSLTDYERYFSSTDRETRNKALKNHIESVRRHIKDLSSKNYQQLHNLNSPDYMLLFIPIEPAFSVALQEDKTLFMEALDKNIVLVTTSTLLATMRTVSHLWKQERQKTNVLEIAKQSGLLYDKFVSFVEDLRSVGGKLEMAQNAYQDAMNKLSDGQRFGDTLVGRSERIRELGAKNSKNLPKDLLEQAAGGE